MNEQHEKELQGPEEGPKTKIHLYLLRAKLKIVPNWNTSGHDDSGLINSLPSMTGWFSKWIDTSKKQTYRNGWPKEKPTLLQPTHKSKETAPTPIDP